MITYKAGNWSLRFALRVSGSVFPKAIVIALPNAILAGLLHGYLRQNDQDFEQVEGVDVLWSGYTFILGFLIVFRSNQSYHRFWEGATLIQQVRGEWFTATSSLVAWCNPDATKRMEVEKFQNLLVRLMSMLYMSALQQVCDLEDDTLEIIDLEGVDKESLEFLNGVPDRCEVLLQWIQRVIIVADDTKVLKVAPPILSRAYQELSRGIVHLNNARKIKEVPFPFPYAQMITVMLVVHWWMTPVIASHAIDTWWWAAVLDFLVICGYWSLLYIATEIDQPFGDDQNDLPLAEMQRSLNQSLLTLLKPSAQQPPTYNYIEPMDESQTLKRSDMYMNSPSGVSSAPASSYAKERGERRYSGSSDRSDNSGGPPKIYTEDSRSEQPRTSHKTIMGQSRTRSRASLESLVEEQESPGRRRASKDSKGLTAEQSDLSAERGGGEAGGPAPGGAGQLAPERLDAAVATHMEKGRREAQGAASNGLAKSGGRSSPMASSVPPGGAVRPRISDVDALPIDVQSSADGSPKGRQSKDSGEDKNRWFSSWGLTVRTPQPQGSG